MALAARVLARRRPDLTPPRSVREDGDPPRIVARASPTSCWPRVVDAARRRARRGRHRQRRGHRARRRWSTRVSDALTAAGIEHGRATRHGLDHQVTVVPVGLVKGLELDATVVVEPAAIVDEEAQGLRALYVALTRATKRLSVVHVGDLPEVLANPVTQADRPAPERSAGVA